MDGLELADKILSGFPWIIDVVEKFLIDDDVFLTEAGKCYDRNLKQEPKDARLDFFKTECTYNASRAYIFKMLVFKHMHRIYAENAQEYLDEYWLGKINKKN